MKACILAGGEGRRLRPLTCRLPKPMVNICDRPVIERIIETLKPCGVDKIAVTLMYMGNTIRERLGSGRELGVEIEYFTEETPLGTAGGVGAAKEFLCDGDFIVIAGDCVTELPLEKAVKAHKESGAEATVVLTSRNDPGEYGLVLTDENGRIVRFTEKPAREQVFSNLINTGIYILSPSVLEEIPSDRPCDFARDLFPSLLRQNRFILGCELEGYWCDIGDTRAYREANLRYAAGDNFIGANASVGLGSSVRDSVVYGTVGAGCEIEGSVICHSAGVGNGCVLGEDCCIGEGAELGDGISAAPGTKVYAGVKLGGGRFISGVITSSDGEEAVFDETGRLCGRFTPEDTAFLGRCAASLLEEGSRVAVGGGLLTLAGGITSAGCGALLFDADSPACAATVGAAVGCALTVFPFDGGFYFFDRDGRAVSAQFGKKLLSAISRRDVRTAGEGTVSFLTGCPDIYAATVAAGNEGRGMSVDTSDRTLKKALQAAGFKVKHPSPISVELTDGGFGFRINGLSSGTSLALLLLSRISEHPERAIAVAYGAPVAFDRLPCRVLRLERDGQEAEDVYREDLFLRDGSAGALTLLSAVAAGRAELERLRAELPDFFITERTVECSSEPSAVMRRLCESLRGVGCEYLRGVRAALDGGYVTLVPGSKGREIRIIAEGESAEFASEISDEFVGRTRDFDQKSR
ncbi:MAG: NTP transferase domain-containing protein [Clostridia bacterium]|nr:NTP transferase domain-containing protein [Clostridia bacterium]